VKNLTPQFPWNTANLFVSVNHKPQGGKNAINCGSCGSTAAGNCMLRENASEPTAILISPNHRHEPSVGP